MKNEVSILVVEDGKTDMLFIQRHFELLNDWNVSFVSAETFKEGRQIIQTQRIDLCFLDYYIDNQTAEVFLKDLTLVKEFVPVILLSNSSDEDLAIIAKEFNLDDYLSKGDISQKTLSRIIRYNRDRYEERNRARNQDAKYKNLLNNSLEAIFTADKDFLILNSNQSFKELIKYKEEATLDFRELFIDDNHEAFFSALVGDTKRKVKRTKLKNLDGKILEVYVSISRILSGFDNASFQVVIHDITELERARIKLYENEKISLIQRMARIIGHEVRNPLTNIVLATEELKDDHSTNEDTSLMLSMIHRNAKRISSLIDNFLDNTRNTGINLKEVVIEKVIMDALNHCKDRIKLKNITFSLKGLDAKTLISIDPDKIQIVLTNIIINAIEALETIQSPQLSLELDVNDKAISIKIKDNGIGMNEENLGNLFQPFYSSKQGGLGLGMTNSKNILDDHAGTITVESELDLGTCFTIELSR